MLADLERLARPLERGNMSHAGEIARLVRIERRADPQTLPPDPLSRVLSACMLSWGGKILENRQQAPSPPAFSGHLRARTSTTADDPLSHRTNEEVRSPRAASQDSALGRLVLFLDPVPFGAQLIDCVEHSLQQRVGGDG
jgi:hypothetical protein